LAFQNDRHSIMDRFDQLVRVSGDDGVRLESLARGLVLPSLPESREREHAAILQTDAEWLLLLFSGFLPFIEPFGRYEAPASRHRISKCGARDDSLRPGRSDESPEYSL